MQTRKLGKTHIGYAVIGYANELDKKGAIQFIRKVFCKKKLCLSAIVMLMCSTVLAQHRLKKLWESDSTILQNPESVLFDAKNKHSLCIQHGFRHGC
jgi:hypothetical protein